MEERDLIKKSRLGDEKAFEELVKPIRSKIFYHALSIVKDVEIAEDLTQDALLHAYQHLNDFKMRSKFSTWVWRIVHNLSLNYLKAQKHPMELKEEKIVYPQSSRDEELLEKIQEALHILTEKEREVFEMYDLDHIPQKEIAVLLKIPHGTVRSRLHSARKKIREYLNHKDLFEQF